MAVPDFQSLMLPLLRTLADQQDHRSNDLFESLATEFKLTPEERRELLPSGRQSKFENRVGWALTYMKKALLLESVGRSQFRITARGFQVLTENPTEIDVQFLARYAEFREFRGVNRQQTARMNLDESMTVTQQSLDPLENFEASYQNIRRKLADDLLEQMKKCPPRVFERIVVSVLVRMGYGGTQQEAAQVVGGSGDEGIDGVIKEDKLGLDVLYVQAKRWEATVGRPIVQAFAGSLEGQRARKGVLITTSQFSQDARQYVERIEKKIVLVDGRELAQLMIDYGVGVTNAASYEIKKIDEDFFVAGFLDI